MVDVQFLFSVHSFWLFASVRRKTVRKNNKESILFTIIIIIVIYDAK